MGNWRGRDPSVIDVEGAISWLTTGTVIPVGTADSRYSKQVKSRNNKDKPNKFSTKQVFTENQVIT
jgi:hypothetical protein